MRVYFVHGKKFLPSKFIAMGAMALTLSALAGCGKFNAQAAAEAALKEAANAGSSTETTGSAKLKWNAVTTNSNATTLTDLAGYKVSYGDAAGTYSTTVDVGNVTNATISTLTKGKKYYFTVKAYDVTGNLSVAATEISKTIN